MNISTQLPRRYLLLLIYSFIPFAGIIIVHLLGKVPNERLWVEISNNVNRDVNKRSSLILPSVATIMKNHMTLSTQANRNDINNKVKVASRLN